MILVHVRELEDNEKNHQKTWKYYLSLNDDELETELLQQHFYTPKQYSKNEVLRWLFFKQNFTFQTQMHEQMFIKSLYQTEQYLEPFEKKSEELKRTDPYVKNTSFVFFPRNFAIFFFERVQANTHQKNIQNELKYIDTNRFSLCK